jgi:membrane dipeptidase
MPRVPAGVLAVALLTAAACGPQEQGGPGLDLVGDQAGARPARGADAGAPGPRVDARTLHETAFVIDLIQDHLFRHLRDGWTLSTPEAHTSLARLEAGGVDLVVSAIPLEPGKDPAVALEEGVAKLTGLVRRTEGRAAIVTGMDEARAARAKGVIPFVLLAEGADGLVGAPPERLAELRRRGLLVVGITGPQGNAFADSGASPRSEGGGLTEKGAGLVAACRDNGVLVDLTHASPEAFWDVIVEQGSLAAVTHAAARALREHSRNLDDLQIIALSRSGGVMGLVFNPELVKPEQPVTGVADLVDHVRHVRRLGAIGALALGTDYGGIRPPDGLDEVSTLPVVTEALLAAGLTGEEVLGVLGGNAAALMEAVEARQGAAEAGREEPLRPITVECESVIGESEGVALRACDGYVVAPGPTLGPATRQRLRLLEVARTPVKVEIFGEAGTPWQVEAQDLGGKVLMRRVVALDRDGVGSLPLPSDRGLVRLFLSPTRRSVLREAVVWGR